jgi:hypothetical protein
LIFGWKATNKPEPRHLKKVILLLVAAKILGFRIHFVDEDEEKKHPIVLAWLLTSTYRIVLTLHSDSWFACWGTTSGCEEELAVRHAPYSQQHPQQQQASLQTHVVWQCALEPKSQFQGGGRK